MSNEKKIDGAHLWKQFDQCLASYAQKNATSRGRQYSENTDPNRLPFQRDRDRIIHTTAFRRLKGKMQVISPGVGDHFRNRLSHTIEVVQIARDLARELQLNEDLAEAIALAHDLGHPPFGHAGEQALDREMRRFKKHFDHNQQSLRVVTYFERRYPDFPGLNLSLEVIEGIAKHETFFDRPGEGSIFSPHLEAQLVDIADEIAYLSADLEDGLRGGFFSIKDLQEVEICAEVIGTLSTDLQQHRSTIIRAVVSRLFHQIVEDSKANLKHYQIKTLQDVQKSKARIVIFSDVFWEPFSALKKFLLDRYYHAPAVLKMTREGEVIIEQLFNLLYRHPEKMPVAFLPEDALEVRVCDYIAGMTDGFSREFLRE